MKKRVISGLIGIPLVAVIFVFMYCKFPIFAIFIALLSAIAAYEIMHVAKVENIAIYVISIIFALIVPFYVNYGFFIPLPVLASLLVFILLIVMLAHHENIKFEHVLVALFSSVVVPLAFSTFIMIRDLYKAYPNSIDKEFCVFMMIIGLSSAWLTDMFAYFVGIKFGKHKMTPNISPKKTYEGAVGGIVGGLILNIIILYCFNCFVFDTEVISYLAIIPISLLLSVISMFGDLSASIVKRNYGAKDYGNLIPGHGGIMDRFDSCLFVMPALYLVIKIYYCFI